MLCVEQNKNIYSLFVESFAVDSEPEAMMMATPQSASFAAPSSARGLDMRRKCALPNESKSEQVISGAVTVQKWDPDMPYITKLKETSNGLFFFFCLFFNFFFSQTRRLWVFLFRNA